MRDDLMVFRQIAYAAASDFHRAQGEYFNFLTSKSRIDRQAAADKVQITGERYMSALQALMNALLAAREEVDTDEITRTQNLMDILDREMKLVAQSMESK